VQENRAGTRSAMHRMPTVFGPSVGPRQGPDGRPYPPRAAGAQRVIVMSFVVRSEAEPLTRLLPDGVALSGEPRVRISASWLEDVGWLAGRGYNVLSVQIPSRVERGSGMVEGEFAAVLWENLADPIITGREELGMPKIYAEISPLYRDGDQVQCTASWDGYIFFEGRIRGLAAQPREVGERSSPVTLNHKYQPRTGEWGVADADYITCSPAESVLVTSLERGEGQVTFRSATWQQLPTLAHIVNVLADLPLEVMDATLAMTRGASDYLGQRIIV
jgi:hypothetical protein